MRNALLVVGVWGAVVGGCGDDPAASEGWLGAEPHASISGSAGEEDVSVKLSDSAAVEAAEIVCEREYNIPVVDGVPDLAAATLVGFEISALLEVNGEQRQFEFDVEGPDLLGHVGKSLSIVPDGAEPEADQAVVEIKWIRVSDQAELLDTAAETGSLTVQELSGTPGEGGVVVPDNEGAVGVTGELRFGANDVLNISFTANCGENDISELVSAP